ncbi:MAG: hypothetical protein QXI32_02810 [Candidatus Bathyarchaeia archaeon]
MSTTTFETLICILKALRSGGLLLKAGSIGLVKIGVTQGEVVVDLLNLEVMKLLLEPLRKAHGSTHVRIRQGNESSLLEALKIVKSFAEKLREEELTIRVMSSGEPVLTMGKKADPRLSRLILGRSIEANVSRMLSLIRALV